MDNVESGKRVASRKVILPATMVHILKAGSLAILLASVGTVGQYIYEIKYSNSLSGPLLVDVRDVDHPLEGALILSVDATDLDIVSFCRSMERKNYLLYGNKQETEKLAKRFEQLCQRQVFAVIVESTE